MDWKKSVFTNTKRTIRAVQRLTGVVGAHLMGAITHVETLKPVIALTFDDGPHPDSTPNLLSVLDKHCAKATFFMVGVRARRFPELVERVARAGHAIGNHSWDHRSLPTLNGRERRQQIKSCGEATAPYGRRLFRPPHGHQNLASYLDAKWLGYNVVAWNSHGHDWDENDPERIFEKLVKHMSPGGIVMLHERLYHAVDEKNADRAATVAAVDSLLEEFSDTYTFVTLPDLLEQGKAQKVFWRMGADRQWLDALRLVD